MTKFRLLLALLLPSLVAQATAQNSKEDLIEELKWIKIESIELAIDDMVENHDVESSIFEANLKRLKELLNQGFSGIESADSLAICRGEEALKLYHAIMLSNPLIKDAQIYATQFELGESARKVMSPKLGTQRNNWTNQQSNDYYGYKAEIVKLSNLSEELTSQTIYNAKNEAVISDLRLHWSGEKLCFTSVTEDGRLNIFEVDSDGEQVAQMLIDTEESDLEFYDGIYLPNGKILAISNIGYQAVPCIHGDAPVGNIVLYDPADKSLRRLTYDQDANWNPVVCSDGKVMYTRWEYTDLMHYYSRMVMKMNPDGTAQKAIYGSGEMFPNSTFDMQPIPGSPSSFAAIISGHHGVARSGRFILFDPAKGNGVEGMLQEIPHRNRKIKAEVKDGLVNGVWPQFIKPMPLNDTYFLVSAKLTQSSLWGLYLVDIFDNVVCIHKSEGMGYITPILNKATEAMPTIPERVDLNDKEATIFIQDIYEGVGLRGIPKGVVKKLRIHAYDYAYNKSVSNHEAMGIQSGWDIKRELGTVPIEDDGSALFKVPANTPISIQPLDKDGRAIQWMRSWITAMPGEVVSCVGCHEDQNTIVIPKRVAASQITPHQMSAPEGGVRPFTFDLEVQPVLDRACVECHNESHKIDLRGGHYTDRDFNDEEKFRKVKAFYRYGIPEFSESYIALHPYVRRQGSEADMAVLQPYEYHANTSELIRMLEVGHHNVKLTEWEWSRLTQWIDYNAPEKGVYAVIKDFKGVAQYERRIELTNKYGCGSGVEWKKELEEYATYLAAQPAQTPQEEDVDKKSKKSKEVKAKGFPFTVNEEIKRRSVKLGDDIEINFVWIPAGDFVMGSNDGANDHKPAHKAKVKSGFWMAETEITNLQYAQLTPEHDSRYVDQMWKDHTTPGYPANLDEMPVIRVSYNDVLEFCAKFKEATGVEVNIPTETQWEWACRAGSDQPFWFGDIESDYSQYENLSDTSTSLMAVTGTNPKPMKLDNPYYDYYNFIPKDESVDDGAMIQTDSKNYTPNPFGLYSMHGNIAEWSRSEYRDYTTDEIIGNEVRYVVRGGSYLDRAKYSTAYSRRAYYPWQRVFNVGFRLIIEE